MLKSRFLAVGHIARVGASAQRGEVATVCDCGQQAPFVLAAAILLGFLVSPFVKGLVALDYRWYRRGRPEEMLLAALPWLLLLVFVVSPMVSSAAFRAFSCEEFDDGCAPKPYTPYHAYTLPLHSSAHPFLHLSPHPIPRTLFIPHSCLYFDKAELPPCGLCNRLLRHGGVGQL